MSKGSSHPATQDTAYVLKRASTVFTCASLHRLYLCAPLSVQTCTSVHTCACDTCRQLRGKVCLAPRLMLLKVILYARTLTGPGCNVTVESGRPGAPAAIIRRGVCTRTPHTCDTGPHRTQRQVRPCAHIGTRATLQPSAAAALPTFSCEIAVFVCVCKCVCTCVCVCVCVCRAGDDEARRTTHQHSKGLCH